MILIDNEEYKIKTFNYSLYFLPKIQVFFTIDFDFNIDNNFYEKFLNKKNQKLFISNNIININNLILKQIFYSKNNNQVIFLLEED